jgi:hypothetical protein
MKHRHLRGGVSLIGLCSKSWLLVIISKARTVILARGPTPLKTARELDTGTKNTRVAVTYTVAATQF